MPKKDKKETRRNKGAKTQNKTKTAKTVASKKPAQKAQGAKANSKAQKNTKPVAPKSKQPAKTTGKSSNAQKNSVKTAVSAKQKISPQQKTGKDLVTVEIRIHNDAKGGHPHIMVDTVDEKFVSVGTTHDKYKGKGHKNIPLETNPLGKSEPAFMHKQGTVDGKKNYSATKKEGKLTAADNAKAKQIGERAKQKYLDKQKKE